MKIEEIKKNTILEAKCPLCNHSFKQWYCPSCGLPISTKDYRRLDFNNFENFQLCSECNTPNPYDAKFCRNCGKDMSLHAKDRNGHGWVDLGLSVLWSTESIDGYYYWMDNINIMLHNICGKVGFNYRKEDDLKNRTIAGKDTATDKWGYKWRMPTKDDFRELIQKCSWDLVRIPYKGHNYKSHNDEVTTIKAFKVTGPNGNHIYLPALGEASGSYTPDRTFMTWHPYNESYGVLFRYWSSTKEMNKVYVFCPKIIGIQADMKESLKEKILERQRLLLDSSMPIDKRMNLFMQPEYVSESHHYEAYSVRPVADKKWLGKL